MPIRSWPTSESFRRLFPGFVSVGSPDSDTSEVIRSPCKPASAALTGSSCVSGRLIHTIPANLPDRCDIDDSSQFPLFWLMAVASCSTSPGRSLPITVRTREMLRLLLMAHSWQGNAPLYSVVFHRSALPKLERQENLAFVDLVARRHKQLAHAA